MLKKLKALSPSPSKKNLKKAPSSKPLSQNETTAEPTDTAPTAAPEIASPLPAASSTPAPIPAGSPPRDLSNSPSAPAEHAQAEQSSEKGTPIRPASKLSVSKQLRDDSWIGKASDGSGHGQDVIQELSVGAHLSVNTDAPRVAMSEEEITALEAMRKQREEVENTEMRKVEEARKAEEEREQNALKQKAIEAAQAEAYARIAKAKEKERAEQDALEAKEEALLLNEIDAKLKPDIAALFAQQDGVRDELETIDAAIASVEEELEEARQKNKEIADIQEKKVALEHVSSLVQAHLDACSQCSETAAGAEKAARHSTVDELGIANRVNAELEECQARLDKQTAHLLTLQSGLTQLNAQCKKSDDDAEDNLIAAISASTARELELTVAENATAMLEKERQHRVESMTEAKLELAKKETLVVASEEKVNVLSVESAADQARTDAFLEQEIKIEEEAKNAVAGSARVIAALDADEATVAQLSLLEDAYRNSLGAPYKLNQDKPETVLLNKTQALMVTLQARGDACREDLSRRRVEHARREKAAKESRIDALCALRAERKAVEWAMSKRREHTSEMEALLSRQEEDVKVALAGIRHLEACLNAVDATIARAKQQQIDAQEAVTRAKNGQERASTNCRDVREASKQRQSNMTLLVNSEAEVTKAQQDYVGRLRRQLKMVEAVSLVDPYAPVPEDIMEEKEQSEVVEPSPAKSEPATPSGGGVLGYLLGRTSTAGGSTKTTPAKKPKNGTSSSQKPAVIAGKIGQNLVTENRKSNQEWADNMAQQLESTVTELKAVQSEVAAAERKAAHEKKRLNVQRSAQVAALARMEAYEQVLESKSPRAVAESPRRTRRTTDKADGKVVARNLDYRDADEAISAQHKFIQEAEDKEDKRVVSEVLGPDNDQDPRINPDVKLRWRKPPKPTSPSPAEREVWT